MNELWDGSAALKVFVFLEGYETRVKGIRRRKDPYFRRELVAVREKKKRSRE